MNRLRGQNRYETARIRVLHIPDADEIPMQVYEVNGFSEAIRSIIIPGEETVREFRLNSADATYGHRLYWGDALGAFGVNSRGSDLARAYGAIREGQRVTGDLMLVGSASSPDVSREAVREIVGGFEYDIDWSLYGVRSPDGKPVGSVLDYLAVSAEAAPKYGQKGHSYA